MASNYPPSASAATPLPPIAAADVAKELKAQVELLQQEDPAKVAAAAAAVMMLATHDASLPTLATAVPPLIALLPSSDLHVRRNSFAALTSLLTRSHSLYLLLATNTQLLTHLVGALSGEVGVRINAAAAIANLAQGKEGSSAVASHGGEAALVASLSLADNTDQSLESLVDAMCALAANSKQRGEELVNKGAVESLSSLLPSPHSSEVHVRTLMAIAMLMPRGNAAARLGAVDGALAALPALARSSDPDVRLIAADLFTTVAKEPELRQVLEKQLRRK